MTESNVIFGRARKVFLMGDWRVTCTRCGGEQSVHQQDEVAADEAVREHNLKYHSEESK